jgi:hypothetical protein
MKTDHISKLVLAIIAIALVTLSVEHWQFRLNTVHAAVPSRQQWEYKVIWRAFYYENGDFQGPSEWREDQTMLPNPPKKDMGAALNTKLAELGAQGWELVSTTPYATNYQVNTERWGSGINEAETQIHANGTTFNDMLVFKRAVH